MCKVSSKTIVRANMRSMARHDSFPAVAPTRRDAIVVGISYNGRQYSQEVTIRQMSESYGRALSSVKSVYGRKK